MYKNFQILGILSIIILLATIALMLTAYFKIDQYFTVSQINDYSIEFYIFIWGIITLATGSFFISWRLILNANAISANKNINLDSKILENDTTTRQYKTYEVDVKLLFDNKNTDFMSDEFIKETISKICRALEFDLAVSFKINKNNVFENWINYALYNNKKIDSFDMGDGLHGQVALDKKAMHIKDIPENYLKITSGSGNILPKNVYIIPVIINNKTSIIIEFADMKSLENNSFEILQNFAIEYSKILKG